MTTVTIYKSLLVTTTNCKVYSDVTTGRMYESLLVTITHCKLYSDVTTGRMYTHHQQIKKIKARMVPRSYPCEAYPLSISGISVAKNDLVTSDLTKVSSRLYA